MAQPTVSVVVPHFNGGFFKRNFLSSIMKTNYPNFEVIIVDDLSTDSNFQRLESICAAKDRDRIRIIRNPSHQGPAASRNRGILNARGDFVAFVETDMEVDPNWITEAMDLFREASPNVGGVQCKVIDINNRNLLQAYGIRIIPETGCVLSIGMGESPENYRTVVDVCSGAVGLIVRRSVLDRTGGFDESLVHNIDDIDLSWRIWISGSRIITCPTAIVYHWTSKPKAIRNLSMGSSPSEFHFNKLPFMLATNYEIKNALKYIPTCLLFLSGRSLVNLARGDATAAKGFAMAMVWGLTNIQKIKAKRESVQSSRKFKDDFLTSKIFVNGTLLTRISRNIQVRRLAASGVFSQRCASFDPKFMANGNSRKPTLATTSPESVDEIDTQAKQGPWLPTPTSAADEFDQEAFSLNLGAGHSSLGDIKADIRKISGIDVLCDALHIPFRDGAFEKVYAHHLLEHFTYKNAEALVVEVRRVLKIGGVLDLLVPNFVSLTVGLAWVSQKISRGPNGIKMVLPMLSGDQDYPENVHLSLWHPRLLTAYLKRLGFITEAPHGVFKIKLVPSVLRGRATVLQMSCKKI